MRNRGRAIGVLFVVILAACAPRPPRQVQLEMREHFSRARGVHTAILYGDLPLARETARVLSESQPTGLPEGRDILMVNVRVAARAVERSRTLGEASTGAGSLAEGCAVCHETYDAGAGIRARLDVTEVGAMRRHMARHRWAVDRLWEGIVALDDDLWKAGVEAFSEPPLDAAELASRGGEIAISLATKLHDLGAGGGEIEGTGARARRFGEILEVCVACHAAAREW